MSLIDTPEIKVEVLESVLDYLPEPKCAELYLLNFDYSVSLQSQLNSLLSRVIIDMPSIEQASVFLVHGLTKKDILDIQGGIYEVSFTKNSPGLQLSKVEWHLDHRGEHRDLDEICEEGVDVEVTPWNICIKYCDKEPDSISDLKKALTALNVKQYNSISIGYSL